MESREQTHVVICEDIDFENALDMISVLVKHSSRVFTQLAEEPKKIQPQNRKEMFFDELPVEFNRSGYMEVAKKLKIPDTTSQLFLRKFVKAGLRVIPVYGNYLKVQMKMSKKG